jgi:hypothetical protein
MVSMEAWSPEDVTAILNGDLEPVLPPDVREVMLDLILAFANLDGSTAFFSASLNDLDPGEGAKKYRRWPIARKFKEAAKAMRRSERVDEAALLDRISEEYADRSEARNRVAHSRCLGVRRSDPMLIVFVPYEKEGPAKHLAIEGHRLARLKADLEWARGMNSTLLAYVKATGFFDRE